MSRHGSRGWGVILVLALVAMGFSFLAAVVNQSRFIANPIPVFLGVGGAAVMVALFLGPVGKVIARMLEGDSQQDDEIAMRLEDLEVRLAELSLEQQRVGELEERLDFTERLLAQREPVERRLPEES